MTERIINTKRMRRYELPGEWIVVAGKTDLDNDHLSLVFSRPDDYWFHVLGCPGSHVLLLAKEDEEPDRKTLEVAASVAAWFSKARNSKMAPVSMTRASQVGKIPGSPAGQVTVKREKIFKVCPALPEVKE